MPADASAIRAKLSTDTIILKSIFVAAGLPLALAASAAPCNKVAAQDVQRSLSEFAKSHIEGDHITVHWTYAIEKQPEAKRLQMVTAMLI